MSRLIDKETIENVKRLHREGVPRKEIARRVWVSLSSVYRILDGIDPNHDVTVSYDKDIQKKIKSLYIKGASRQYIEEELGVNLSTVNPVIPVNRSDRQIKDDIKKLHKKGVSRKHISEMLGVSLSTVYRTVPTTHAVNCFTRVEGDKACTYKLIKVEPLKELLEGRGAVGTPVQCQEVSKPASNLQKPVREAFDSVTKTFGKLHLSYDPEDAKNIKYVAPRLKASVIVEGYVEMLVKSYSPAIPLEFQERIKTRAMDTFRGFTGNLMEMATKAVHHAVKEAAIR